MKDIKEDKENSYTVVHAKHGKEVIKATSSYSAAKKYADMKKLKSTAGVDAHLMEGPFKGVGKALMKRKLNKQYKKSDLANFDDLGIDTSGKTTDEINQMKSDYYHDHMDKADRAKNAINRLSKNVKYGIIRYPDTAISYIKNDGSGWTHMYDKSYGFEGPVDKADMKYALAIKPSKVPSRMMDEGYYKMPDIDRERYTEMPGLEGPFQTRSGKVVYYDPKEGAYYDRDTDMYMTYDEFKQLDEGRLGFKDIAKFGSEMASRIDQEARRRGSADMEPGDADELRYKIAKEMGLIEDAPQSSPRPKPRPKRMLRPKPRPTINIGSNPETGATRGINPRDNYSPEDLKRLLMQSAMEDMNEGFADQEVMAILQKYPREHAALKQGADIMDFDELYQDLFSYFSNSGDMPYDTMKARDGDPYQWIQDELDHLGLLEGDGRKKGIHPKGHPMRKKQQAAIHAGESKLQDMRKALELSESIDANTVVAQYTRACLDQRHSTWGKVCEQIDYVRSFVKEDVDVSNVRLQIRKMHEQEGLDRKIQIKENVNKLRQIVKDKSAMSIKFADGSMKVDMTTASIFLQVFDKVKEQTQAKIVDKIQTKAGFLSVLDKMYSMIG
tara:strand:- start:19 stop:1854 length:1836 start_codon:yes stop_codon:yes gene_type:complete